MSSSVSGNCGGSGTSGAGATVQCVPSHYSIGSIVIATADVSGNFSFTGITAPDTYIIRAFLPSFTYAPVAVAVDGVTAYTAVNLTPVAVNAVSVYS